MLARYCAKAEGKPEVIYQKERKQVKDVGPIDTQVLGTP
jgi:hypothetical protein